MQIMFSIEAPPSANTCYRSVGSKVLKSSAYRDWIAKAAGDVLLQVGFMEPLDGPLKVQLTATPKDHRLRDLDNYFKPCLDLLEVARIIKNDRDVIEIHAHRNPPNKSHPHKVFMVVTTVAQGNQSVS